MEQESHEGKRIVEAAWPVFKYHHQKSRYIYDMYYKKAMISKELYEYCLENSIADSALIAKWKKVFFLCHKTCLLILLFCDDSQAMKDCVV